MTSLIPLIFVSVIFIAFAWPMIKRKGLSYYHLLWLFAPGINSLVLIWIASQPDKAILDELAALREKIGSQSSN